MTFIDTFAKQLAANPTKPLISEVHGSSLVPADGTVLTDLAARARGTLRAHNLKPGDRVVLVAPNSIHWVAADLAALFEGAIVVPMYARQDPAELGHMMADCAPVLVLAVDDALAGVLRPHTGDVPIVVFEDLFNAEPVTEGPAPRAPTDPVTIIYTSGTSGDPKGVVYTVANVDFMLPRTQDAIAAMMGPTEGDDRVFHYLPFCFAGSRIVLWTCLFRGNGMMVSTDLDDLATEFKTAAPNYFLNVPMLLERIKNGVQGKIRQRSAPIQWLYDRGEAGFLARVAGTGGRRDALWEKLAKSLIFDKIHAQIGTNLRCLICGSAPLGEDTQRWFQMIGIPVYQVYGLTETTAIVTMDIPPEVEPGRVGHALPGVDTQITEEGELLVRGPNLFSHYWNKPEQTSEAIVDGWFHTGDQAEVDSTGNWKIIGRVKNLLVPTSGHNVAPEPIEQKLLENLEGADAVVLVGHGKPYIGALISGEGVDRRAAEAAVAAVNQDLPHYRRIRKWALAPEPFTIENGLLTANRKLKRAAIESALAAEIDALYA